MSHSPVSLESLPAAEAAELTWITVDEMRAIDDFVTRVLRIELRQMMENAGRSLADAARLLLGGSVLDRSILVLAGPGGNGGGGLAAARHLANAGARVDVVLGADRSQLARTTRAQFEILESIRLPHEHGRLPAGDPDLVVDALLGYSQNGPPRGDLAVLIEGVQDRRVLSLDVPSGIELSTGILHAPHVRAEATVTLASPKTGLRGPAVGGAPGTLLLADISVPAAAFSHIEREWHTPFGAGPLVRIV